MNNKSLLIERVYKLELTQRATLVAFYLINRADQESSCFPSVKTIAKECHMSTRTVQRALNDLAESGFLKRESRFHEMGGQRSNMYYLLIDESDGYDDLEASENECFSEDNVQVDEPKEIVVLGGDRYSKGYSNNKVNNSKVMEKMDFSMYLRNQVEEMSVTWGLCQRDGP